MISRVLPRFRWLSGHGVGLASMAEPSIIAQQAKPWCSEEAHFRHQLAGLLTAVVKAFGKIAVKEHHGFAKRNAVFAATQDQHINTRPPGDIGGVAPEASDRIGETRAVSGMRRVVFLSRCSSAATDAGL